MRSGARATRSARRSSSRWHERAQAGNVSRPRTARDRPRRLRHREQAGMSAHGVAIVQANVTDLLAGDADPSHYVIAPLKASRRIERVVIAAPDTPPNQA